MGNELVISNMSPGKKPSKRAIKGKTLTTKFCLMCCHGFIHFRFTTDSEKDMVRYAEEFLINKEVPRDDWKNFVIMRNMEDILGGPIWVVWSRPW